MPFRTRSFDLATARSGEAVEGEGQVFGAWVEGSPVTPPELLVTAPSGQRESFQVTIPVSVEGKYGRIDLTNVAVTGTLWLATSNDPCDRIGVGGQPSASAQIAEAATAIDIMWQPSQDSVQVDQTISRFFVGRNMQRISILSLPSNFVFQRHLGVPVGRINAVAGARGGAALTDIGVIPILFSTNLDTGFDDDWVSVTRLRCVLAREAVAAFVNDNAGLFYQSEVDTDAFTTNNAPFFRSTGERCRMDVGQSGRRNGSERRGGRVSVARIGEQFRASRIAAGISDPGKGGQNETARKRDGPDNTRLGHQRFDTPRFHGTVSPVRTGHNRSGRERDPGQRGSSVDAVYAQPIPAGLTRRAA